MYYVITKQEYTDRLEVTEFATPQAVLGEILGRSSHDEIVAIAKPVPLQFEGVVGPISIDGGESVS